MSNTLNRVGSGPIFFLPKSPAIFSVGIHSRFEIPLQAQNESEYQYEYFASQFTLTKEEARSNRPWLIKKCRVGKKESDSYHQHQSP